jgi:Flavin containing amine oxidoreductase
MADSVPSLEDLSFLDPDLGFDARTQWTRLHAAHNTAVHHYELAQELKDGNKTVHEGIGLPLDDWEKLLGFGALKEGRPDQFPEIELPIPEKSLPEFGAPPKVAIIGAGAAGLFTAMIFDYLNKNAGDHGFNVDYDILEAQDRVGGRLYTFSFDENNSHLYYDIGAMRYPDNVVMKRYDESTCRTLLIHQDI